jgi:hypothetical protein
MDELQEHRFYIKCTINNFIKSVPSNQNVAAVSLEAINNTVMQINCLAITNSEN